MEKVGKDCIDCLSSGTYNSGTALYLTHLFSCSMFIYIYVTLFVHGCTIAFKVYFKQFYLFLHIANGY